MLRRVDRGIYELKVKHLPVDAGQGEDRAAVVAPKTVMVTVAMPVPFDVLLRSEVVAVERLIEAAKVVCTGDHRIVSPLDCIASAIVVPEDAYAFISRLIDLGYLQMRERADEGDEESLVFSVRLEALDQLLSLPVLEEPAQYHTLGARLRAIELEVSSIDAQRSELIIRLEQLDAVKVERLRLKERLLGARTQLLRAVTIASDLALSP